MTSVSLLESSGSEGHVTEMWANSRARDSPREPIAELEMGGVNQQEEGTAEED